MEIYSVTEAAKKLGLDTSQVRRLLILGKIKGKKLTRDWVVLSLDYKKKKFGVGRKKKEVRNETEITEAIGQRTGDQSCLS
jgi:hypothetical protein